MGGLGAVGDFAVVGIPKGILGWAQLAAIGSAAGVVAGIEAAVMAPDGSISSQVAPSIHARARSVRLGYVRFVFGMAGHLFRGVTVKAVGRASDQEYMVVLELIETVQPAEAVRARMPIGNEAAQLKQVDC